MSITISPEQAVERYGLNKGSLANMRSRKQGPPYLKIGRKCLYPVKSFEAWLFQNPVRTIDSIQG
jgi:hypothetical protein